MKKSILALVAAFAVGAAGMQAFAAPPPPPPSQHHGHGGPGMHGRRLPSGMRWCVKCDGKGFNRTWYGRAKKCHICNGTGMMAGGHGPAPVPPMPSAGHGNGPHHVNPSAPHPHQPGNAPRPPQGGPQQPGRPGNPPPPPRR